MTHEKNLAGKIFTRLTVLHRDVRAENDKKFRRGHHWVCQCSCGTIKSVRADRLMSEKTRSCGCLPRGEYITRGSRVAGDRTDKMHDIPTGTYHALFMKQRGQCAICESTAPLGRRLCLDHDHTTGAVRGLLCSRCNIGLGYFQDNQIRLARALNYLAAVPTVFRGRLAQATSK